MSSKTRRTKALERFPPGVGDMSYEENGMPSPRTERFLREMPPGTDACSGTALKCAAGLAVLSLFAAIGAGTTDVHPLEGSGDQPVRVTKAASEGARAVAHRKSLFDQRRARIDGVAFEHRIAMQRRPRAEAAAR